jgi:26S proteasome regulatory subunit N9
LFLSSYKALGLTWDTDDEERLTFLQSVAKKVDRENSQDALVFASVAVARVKLELEDLEGARKDLDSAERILDNFDSVETIVHAAFYDANALYYQVRLAWINILLELQY